MIGLAMYCPHCSQQQISEEMRFCARCGFPLAVVKELIANNGSLVTTLDEPQALALSRALKGAKQGAWIMLASLIGALIAALWTTLSDDFAVFFIAPCFGFALAVLRIFYAVFFESRGARERKQSSLPASPTKALSASPGVPVDVFRVSSKRTGEVVQPASVTEKTTTLLDDV